MSVEENFQQALEKLKTLPDQPNDIKLDIYALYKQATQGDASGKKPGLFDLVKKAKFDAWETRKGLSKEAAMEAYVKLVDELAAKG